MLSRSSIGSEQPRLGNSALYTATTREGAIAEYRKAVNRIGPAAFGPRDLVSLDVVVEPVCDLTRPAARRYYGLTFRQARGDLPDGPASAYDLRDGPDRDPLPAPNPTSVR